MHQGKSPFVCHVFVCTNDCARVRKSCADGASLTVHQELKRKIEQSGLTERVRISQSGCLGRCAEGPNLVIYPQNIWFSNISPGQIGQVIGVIEEILAKNMQEQ